MKIENIPQSNQGEPTPGSFDFEKAQFERERELIAQRYNVLNPETLTLKDGVWYKGDMTVEEWASLFDEDDSQPRYRSH